VREPRPAVQTTNATLDNQPVARVAKGPASALVVAYCFFVLAAGARSGVQLATHPARAPLAYALSGLAAAIYLAGGAAIAAVQHRPARRRVATLICSVELAGVFVVGTLSVAWPAGFPDATVWSTYGAGYGFVPLALPVLALVWLHRGDHRPLVRAIRHPSERGQEI
jgi:hypothetical protein